ncbi:MAG: hypothetical protein IMW89_11810 [Ktedonobacteraceae bacterium]|nr:hypothetical protein [Ktedonobacteraceae bacterium]
MLTSCFSSEFVFLIRIAAETIADAFERMPADVTARQAVDLLTAAISDLYRQHEVGESVQADPVQRAIAVFVAISLSRREIWLVGDCQSLVNGELFTCLKEVDSIIANARSLFLEAEIAQGRTIAELREHDSGREFILPLIRRQMVFQNRPDRGQYWYAAIGGFAVPDEGIVVHPLPPDTTTIVLASDGYPVLRGTLAESERELEQVLREDPLLFRRYRSVKGLVRDSVSFDDRAYVRLRVWRGERGGRGERV